MRKLLLVCLLANLMLLAAFTTVDAQDGTAISVTCPNGNTIENAVEVVVNMRPGFTYIATAIGINGFDPVMAVMDRGEVRACTDDSGGVEDYTANLPTTGQVESSRLNAQLPLSHNYNDFEDISVIVGGFDAQNGEFVLILEGMALTQRNTDGDSFALQITENIVNADTDVSVYMLSTDAQLDPLMRVVDAQSQTTAECNDAGTELCEDNTASLSSAYASRRFGRQTEPNRRNAMLTLPTSSADFDLSNGQYANFIMTSFQEASTGDYVVAFHIDIDDGSGDGDEVTQQQDPVTPSNSNDTVGGGGIDVTCPDGQPITNGVEIIVNMRPGFTYTATVLGIDGFDPMLAVMVRGAAESCNNDSDNAENFQANLPSTGRIASSTLNAQLPFSHSFNGFEDISLVIGGLNGSVGEFLLIVQGMAVTSADGPGDPFAIRLTPNIVNSDINTTVYMIGVQESIDPLVRFIDAEEEDVLYCDDAGTNLCAAGSSSLNNSSISRSNTRTVDGDNFDAMLVIPTTTYTDFDFSRDIFMDLRMTSYQQRSFGDYLVAFHIGIEDE